MKRKPKPREAADLPPTPEAIAAKLAQLDALRKRVKAAAGPAKPKAKRRGPQFDAKPPRFD